VVLWEGLGLNRKDWRASWCLRGKTCLILVLEMNGCVELEVLCRVQNHRSRRGGGPRERAYRSNPLFDRVFFFVDDMIIYCETLHEEDDTYEKCS